MKKSYKFVWAFLDSEYPSGTIEIDEDAKEVEATYEKRSFLGKKKTSLVKFKYDAKTKVSSQENEVTIDALTIRIDDQVSLAEVIEILRKPKREAISYAEKKLDEVKKAVKEFFTKRAEALSMLIDLKSNPREKVLKLASMVPDDAEDPIEWVLQTYRVGLQQIMKDLKAMLDAEGDLLGQTIVESIFALIYGIGLYQDSIYLKDENRSESANKLLSNLGCKSSLPMIKDINVQQADPTEKPLEEGFKLIMDQIKEPFFISSKLKEENKKDEASKSHTTPQEEVPKITESSEKIKVGNEFLTHQELYDKTLYSYSLIWGMGSASTKANLEKDIKKLMERGMTRDQALAQLYESVIAKK